MSDFTRREFLEAGSAVFAGAGLATTFPHVVSAKKAVPPSDQLRFGVIGVNGMGWANLQTHRRIDGVECTALCDVDRNVLDERAAELEAMTGETPTLYEDYRRLLEDDDLDFVVIATPDHWHCLQTVHACEAGKDVYVEKPLANSIGECLTMVEAAEKHGTLVQVGQWQRSGSHWAAAVDYVQSGTLGTIRHVKTWIHSRGVSRLEPASNASVPEGVNYDLWLGPAPERSFDPNRFHHTWRFFWDYGGGTMTDWGVHLLDYALLGMSVQQPQSVVGMGGKFAYPDGATETPDTQKALYRFDGFTVEWGHANGVGSSSPYGRSHGVAFIGEHGTLVVDRGGWEVLPEVDDEEYALQAIPPREGGGGLDAHAENFVAAIREGAELNCPIEAAANTAIVAHLGNIANRVHDHVAWDSDEQRFVDAPAADKFVWPAYRSPWTLPEV